MYKADDVNRMREEKDVDGLILVLKSESDPLVKWLAAKSLGDVGKPGDQMVITALQNCLTGDPMVAAGASTSLSQLEAKPINGTRVREKKAGGGAIKRTEKSAAQPQQKRVIHRKAIFWIGVIMVLGLCVMVPVMVELNLPPWTVVPMSFSPIIGMILIVIAYRPKKSTTGTPTSPQEEPQPQKKQIIYRKAFFWIGILMVPIMCVVSSMTLDQDAPPGISILITLSLIVGIILLIMAFVPKRSTKKATTFSKVKKDYKVPGELKKTSICPSCGKSVTQVSIELNGKNINGVKCKRCNQVYCLSCYNPTTRLLTCEKCGNKEFSFLVDGV